MLIYVACWPLLAYFAGNLIPAIGSGDLSKVFSIIVKSLFIFLVQKIAQFGQDVFIAKPSLEISEVMRGNLFSRIQKTALLLICSSLSLKYFLGSLCPTIAYETPCSRSIFGDISAVNAP